MKGKIFKYDKATHTMVPVSDANVIPLLESKNEDGITVGFGLIEVPASEPPKLKLNEQERENLRQVLRKADQHAEDSMERRDCIQVQERIAMMREQYGIDE
jgi:hypothetical protein